MAQSAPVDIARTLVTRHLDPLRLVVDEDRLDLNVLTKQPIPHWQPTTKAVVYEQVSKLYIDIETLGLNPRTDRIIAVGLRDECGVSYKICDQNEPWLLKQTMAALKKKSPQLLIGYNHLAFDLPFIIERCKQHQVQHPFKVSSKEKRIRAARMNGKPLMYRQIYVDGLDLIDVYHQVLIHDFST
ncbi:MAG: ribonuclease H-like domain-containing protein, partial [Cyanobacteria bacterium P01_G01_bin.38]